MSVKAVIGAQNLARRFGRTVAVRDVSVQVAEGKAFGFLGPASAGDFLAHPIREEHHEPVLRGQAGAPLQHTLVCV